MGEENSEVVLDLESDDPVIDNASLLYFDEKEPWKGTELALRLFLIKRGFSVPAQIPGHYLVANEDSENNSKVTIVEAPCEVQFKDEGQASRLLLSFKKYGHGQKICAVCIDLPLQIAAANGDKDAKWNTWKDNAASVKLDCIKSFKPLTRHDGNDMVKALAAWLKASSASNFYKEIGFKNLNDIRSFMSSRKYSSSMTRVCAAATLRVRKQVKAAAGGPKAGDKSKAAGTAEASEAEKAECNRQILAIEAVKAYLHSLEPFYGAPLGARLIECAIPPAAQDGSIDTEALVKMIESESIKDNADKLLAVVRKQDNLKLLDGGAAPRLSFASPFLVKPQKAPEAESSGGKEADAVAVDTDSESDSNSNSKKDNDEEPPAKDIAKEQESSETRRSGRKPKSLNMDSADTAAKPAPKEKKGKKEAKSDLGGKRKYEKTGMYSTDPHVRALARMKSSGYATLPSPAISSADGEALFTPPPGLLCICPCDLNLPQFKFVCACARRPKRHYSEAEG